MQENNLTIVEPKNRIKSPELYCVVDECAW